MRLFGRRLPAAKRPAIERDERVVAWAKAPGDLVVVATNRGLWLPEHPQRLGWHEIHKANWSGKLLSLVPAYELKQLENYSIVADSPAVHIALTHPADVPDEVRKRVTRSIAYTAHHALASGGGVRVVARRVSGVNGLRWTVRYDEGTIDESESVRRQTTELVAQGRGSSIG